METSGSQPPGGSAAWASWVAFAGVMLMLIGVFSVIAGLSAAFENDYFMNGPFDGDLFAVNTTILGLAWIVIGVIKVFAGFALIQGREWARYLTILLCFFHAVVDLTVLGKQPFLSIIFIALNVTILYAVTVRWQVAKVGMGD